jgi:hypothetical protein
VGALVMAVSRRFGSKSAEQRREDDPRPPVLLLRAFAADNATFVQDQVTLEEAIEPVLSALGPVVAIGRPGEWLAPAGAGREYVAEEAWRGRVDELMREASMIVLLVGSGRSLAWEFQQIVERGRLATTLLVMPPPFNRAKEWAAFVANLPADLAARLPRIDPKKTLYVFFEPDGRPFLILGKVKHYGQRLLAFLTERAEAHGSDPRNLKTPKSKRLRQVGYWAIGFYAAVNSLVAVFYGATSLSSRWRVPYVRGTSIDEPRCADTASLHVYGDRGAKIEIDGTSITLNGEGRLPDGELPVRADQTRFVARVSGPWRSAIVDLGEDLRTVAHQLCLDLGPAVPGGAPRVRVDLSHDRNSRAPSQQGEVSLEDGHLRIPFTGKRLADARTDLGVIGNVTPGGFVLDLDLEPILVAAKSPSGRTMAKLHVRDDRDVAEDVTVEIGDAWKQPVLHRYIDRHRAGVPGALTHGKGGIRSILFEDNLSLLHDVPIKEADWLAISTTTTEKDEGCPSRRSPAMPPLPRFVELKMITVVEAATGRTVAGKKFRGRSESCPWRAPEPGAPPLTGRVPDYEVSLWLLPLSRSR